MGEEGWGGGSKLKRHCKEFNGCRDRRKTDCLINFDPIFFNLLMFVNSELARRR